jgi:hypothetical protein
MLRRGGVARGVRLGRAAAELSRGEFRDPVGGFQPKLAVRDQAKAGGRDLHSSVIGKPYDAWSSLRAWRLGGVGLRCRP